MSSEARTADSPVAYVDEVFLSLQGEGGEFGRPQLFLRLGGCPLRCRYCDSPRTWTRGSHCTVHRRDGDELLPNPLAAEALDDALATVAREHGAEPDSLTLAVTGGEPLAQTDFLDSWLPRWPGQVMLETAGIWPDRLERLLPQLDCVSLDWKLASTLASGASLVAAAECARLVADSGLAGWVKVVLTDGVVEEELSAVLAELARAAPGLRVFLQPVTPFAGTAPPPSERLLTWSLRFRELPLRLRVLPQIHPVLGAR